MYSRTVRSNRGTHTLKDMLISIFTAELIQPSEEMYLISPFMSNVPFMDNQFGHYTDLFPLVKSKQIYLSDILQTLAWKGTDVRVICDPERPETMPLLSELRGVVSFRKLEENHEKGLFTDHFYIHGSMNFTYRGVYVNKETVRSTWEEGEVRQALLSARARWQEAEPI
ncbi:hypothetical protein KB559_13470 [Paenibacillus sp. Marseille-P2973]|uniref:phospholipase D-like domain-containing protein DpdK n=1 Tax=Paenibacillus sp. Marseille-P2973 TaxID=1871032 RepID=UPI001B5845E8|nr:phospholipase D-like domain-containing protein DpdK [Paenibacillus sp. Marseille-P2973]MBQ4899854.1 hypothetical protein [Paenibacillus sp. Marseille-P2973]